MNDLAENVGGLVTAGLVGEAVTSELAALPGTGGPAPERCANCGTPLAGPFCHACGQRGHVHRSVMHLVEELLHGVLHFEGRAWRTLPSLFFRPGQLTWRYVHGERARFVSPMALFLFSVFLLFLVPGSVGRGPAVVGPTPEGQQALAGAKTDLLGELATAEARAREASAALQEARAAGRPTAELERTLDEANEEVSASRLASQTIGMLSSKGAVDELSARIDTGHPAFDRAVVEKLANPELLLYKLKSHAYKLSWALVLIAMPFMWLLFCLRRDVRMYDHAIFLLFSLSFVSIFAVVMSLVARAPGVAHLAPIVVMLGIPLHVFAQLKGAYRLTTGSALWRTGAMLFFAQIWLVLFLLLIVALDLWH